VSAPEKPPLIPGARLLYEIEVCRHPDEPHTVWWMRDDEPDMPVPLEAKYDNLEDARPHAENLTKNPHVEWVKIFRSDNEGYTCWRWNRPERRDLSDTEAHIHVEGESRAEFDEAVQGDETELVEFRAPEAEFAYEEGDRPRRWWLIYPSYLQQQLVLWSLVGACVAVFVTIVILCILFLVKVSGG
jgi:hypothetical protein